MAGRKSDFTLPKFDDIFSTQEMRDDEKLAKIRDIPLELIDNFPDHPYRVQDDEDMERLVESIKERGVITPAMVRQKEDGRYELVSGHRRKRASELAGFETLRCEVVELTRDEAIILMVESNYQRTQQLPSERAFAYKMRLDALARQGKRTDLTCATELHKSDGKKSRDTIADKSGETVRRYVRLTYLISELLDLVDNSVIKDKDSLQMALKPAVELSYLDEDCQRDVFEEIDVNDCTPSHAQSIRLKKMSQDCVLTKDQIYEIMSEEKPNQQEHLRFRREDFNGYFPKSYTEQQIKKDILKGLELLHRHRQRNRDAR